MQHLVAREWAFLKAHPQAVSPMPNVPKIAQELWDNLKESCDFNEVEIDAAYDYNIFSKPPYLNVLAFASRTMWLINNTWVSTAMSGSDRLKGSIYIRVNPYVPNGWYEDDGSCEIGNRFDLKSVLRHELLHGVGLSSSIYPPSVGYYIRDQCYPFKMDTKITDSSGNFIVKGCNITTSTSIRMYVNNIELYNPTDFQPGSSYSHSKEGIMFYAIPSRQCLEIDDTALRMLNGLGAQCKSTNFHTSSGHIQEFSLFILLFIFILHLLKN